MKLISYTITKSSGYDECEEKGIILMDDDARESQILEDVRKGLGWIGMEISFTEKNVTAVRVSTSDPDCCDLEANPLK